MEQVSSFGFKNLPFSEHVNSSLFGFARHAWGVVSSVLVEDGVVDVSKVGNSTFVEQGHV